MKMNKKQESNRIHTIVIGGGQAGLAVGYHLAKQGILFKILDANPQVGDAWRNRWDSLRLFTPARYAGLPGLQFPASGSSFPTKDQTADYLRDYARHFHLPVRNGIRVDRLHREDGRFVISAGKQRFESQNVVVAMSNYQEPYTPAFASELNPEIVQLHSHAYRNPGQLQPGGVLVVGVGNSGADIAVELAHSHPTWIAGQESGHIPWPVESVLSKFFLVRLVRFVGHHVLTVKTPFGRKARPKLLRRAAPLIRVKPKDLLQGGITRVPRVSGVKDGLPLLADGRTLPIKNVIWCTGYHHSFPWIDLPVFGADGEPMHQSGIVERMPGLYFVGLHFLYSMTSATLLGVGRDGERIAKAIASRQSTAGLQSTHATESVEQKNEPEFALQTGTGG
jgi:putative flavoprotein involved in K+ transport